MPRRPNLTYTKATIKQIPAMKALADANRNEVGFINRAKFLQTVEEERTIVAILRNQVIGFVIFRHRKTDDQTTLSEICLDRAMRGQGYGRGLINALCKDCVEHSHTLIRLKCPVDLAANAFYEHLGFKKVATETGKVRQLNVWELPIAETR